MTQETVHFIGIGGIGMSGLAQILLQQGKSVSGSDIAESYITQELKKKGAKIFIGHNKEHVSHAKTVVFTTDIQKDNPELIEAREKQRTLLHRSDLLLALMNGKAPLAVTGTHGKTTTSALLAHLLHVAGLDPAFAVGGIIPSFSTNATAGNGKYFVVEADESDATFLKYPYYAAIVTNIDNDHVAHFGSMQALIDAFSAFMKKAPREDLIFYCGDDPILSTLRPKGISYGFTEHVQLAAKNIKQAGWSTIFDIEYRGNRYEQIELALVGKHNVLNALGVFGLALALHIEESVIRKAFQTFSGVKRRLEKKGVAHSVLILDDYAHHPVEIKTTLEGVKKAILGRRLIAVYQPHRYSRMRYLMNDFQDVFLSADEVVVTDLYTANESAVQGVSTESICAMIKASNNRNVRYFARNALVAELSKMARPHDVIIFLGAGDSTKAASECYTHFLESPVKKLVVGIVYGGMNSEHEISCLSKDSIVSSLSKDHYIQRHFKIEKDGSFLTQEVMQELQKCDLFIPVLHGPYGEDGTIQGFFEMLRKPYVGCDVRSCAVSMDKAFTKWIAQANGILTSPFISIAMFGWQQSRKTQLLTITKKLSFPLYVKPSHLGSTIGVSRANDIESLEKAIDAAFEHDSHVIVEQEIQGREIEFAVMGNSEVQVAQPGEVVTDGKMYSYDAKYGDQAFKVEVNPDLPKEVITAGQVLAKRMYMLASCRGLARVDFFLDASHTFWLNEINPFPGFTHNSLYPKMWENSGVSFEALLDQLIIWSLERQLHGYLPKTACS